MKILNIEIPAGHEVDLEQSILKENDVKIVIQEIKKPLPKTWKELERVKGYYVGTDSFIREAVCTTLEHNKNTFATKELAEASIAMAQLSQLREVYRNGWKPNWDNRYQDKYVLRFEGDILVTGTQYYTATFLSFQSEEIRDEFLENFRDLIETAKPLLS